MVDGGSGDDTISGEDQYGEVVDDASDRLLGGPGDDRVYARGGGRDVIDCGPGRDVAFVDRRDRTRGCETVRRR